MAHYQAGDTTRAIEIQERAIAAAESTGSANLDEYAERLEAMRRGEAAVP